jgi:hypothetical protein
MKGSGDLGHIETWCSRRLRSMQHLTHRFNVICIPVHLRGNGVWVESGEYIHLNLDGFKNR